MRNKLIYFALMNITLLGLLAACSRPLNPARPALAPNPTDTPTSTSTPSVIFSFTPTGTSTPTATPSLTPTNIFTFTPSPTATSTFTATSTSTSTTTFSPTPTVTGGIEATGICPTYLLLTTNGSNSSDQLSNFTLILEVNGLPETTDGVTLVTPEGNISVPFVGLRCCGVPNMSGNNSADYSIDLSALNRPYDGGSTYSVIITTSIGTVTSSMIAPGGNVSVSSDGVTVTWNGNSNFNVISNSSNVYSGLPYVSYTSPAGVTSPFIFPASAYPETGQYGVYVHFYNESPVVGPNSNPTTPFEILDGHTFTINH